MLRILLPITLMVLALLPTCLGLTIDERGLMVGYTSTNLLPLLENSSLEFQLGEELWARAVGGEVEVALKSPRGLESIHEIKPSELALLKTFNEESDVGIWILEIINDGSMHIVVKDPEKTPSYVGYRISEKYLVAELEGSPNAVFIEVEGLGRYPLIAGEDNWLNLSILLGEHFEAKLGKEIMTDVLLENSIVYEGFLRGSAYRLEIEPLMVRTMARVEDTFLHIHLPAVHEPDTEGIIPLRPGKAIIRIWLNETHAVSRPAYILDKRFIDLVKMPVDRIVFIPLRDALNRSIKVVKADGEKAKSLELTPPLALLRIQDQYGNQVANVSIITSTPVSIVNNTAYILLRRNESLPASPSPSLKAPIRVYVNGFEASSITISLISGKAYNLTISLRRLTLEIIPQDGELPKNLKLRINGTTFKHENGTCSYLLPPGEYVIEATAPGLRGSANVNLSENSKVKIILKKVTRLEDALRISAIAELACALILAYINYRDKKICKRQLKLEYRRTRIPEIEGRTEEARQRSRRITHRLGLHDILGLGRVLLQNLHKSRREGAKRSSQKDGIRGHGKAVKTRPDEG